MGFDNHEYVADGVYPGLTTIELPHYDMGVWGAEHLFTLIDSDNDGVAAESALLRGPVIHRGSVAPPSS